MTIKGPKLNDKQQRFVEEYLIDLNAKQAGIRAGYKENSIDGLFNNKKIKEAIEIAKAERSRRTGYSQERVLNELAKLAFVNITDIVDSRTGKIKKDATREDLACIQSVKLKPNEFGTEREVKVHDKMKALELLGKHLGTFRDGADINITGTVKFVDDI